MNSNLITGVYKAIEGMASNIGTLNASVNTLNESIGAPQYFSGQLSGYLVSGSNMDLSTAIPLMPVFPYVVATYSNNTYFINFSSLTASATSVYLANPVSLVIDLSNMLNTIGPTSPALSQNLSVPTILYDVNSSGQYIFGNATIIPAGESPPAFINGSSQINTIQITTVPSSVGFVIHSNSVNVTVFPFQITIPIVPT